MVDSYLRALRSILDSGGLDLERSTTIECKHFFSGAAAYADGRIFMTLTPVGLALKLRLPDRAALLDQGAAPLRYFPGAPVKKDYVVIPESLCSDDSALVPWISASVEFCKTLPRPRSARTPGRRR